MNDITLVTGGNGFVGQVLVRALLERGEPVRVLDLSTEHIGQLPIDVIIGSVTNRNVALKACEGVTSVFHLAGNAQLWSTDPAVFERVNHIGTRVMLDAAERHGVASFVHCSSLTTLVGEKTPIGVSDADETIVLPAAEMLGPYPRSKRLAEIAAQEFAEANSMRVVIAQPTEPLGPGDEALTPPTQMILDFVNGKTPAYIDCILNFVPVDCLARGLLIARDMGRNGERYLLGGENIELSDLLKRLETLTGRQMPQRRLPYWVALTAGVLDTHINARLTGGPPKAPLTGVRLAGRQVRFSSQKAQSELGWQAAPPDEALGEMLRWAFEKGLVTAGT